MTNSNKPIKYIQYESGRWQTLQSEIIVEQSVTLTINGEEWLTMMCTPQDQDALAVGFLYNEGLIQSMDEVASVRTCPTGDIVDVWLNHVAEKPKQWRRTSGCTGGMTGVDSTPEAPLESTALLEDDFRLTPDQITQLIVKLFESQELYRRSGGVHTSALSDGEQILASAEDIGRHNTLDKLAGFCLLEPIPGCGWVILTTGRISSEMLQKSARLGAKIVISRTSPSSLSIQLAEQMGITLIGYTRRNRFNVYAHPYRLNIPTEREAYVKQTPQIQTH